MTLSLFIRHYILFTGPLAAAEQAQAITRRPEFERGEPLLPCHGVRSIFALCGKSAHLLQMGGCMWCNFVHGGVNCYSMQVAALVRQTFEAVLFTTVCLPAAVHVHVCRHIPCSGALVT